MVAFFCNNKINVDSFAIKAFLFIVFIAASYNSVEAQQTIYLNQAGFYPGGIKKAVVCKAAANASFFIVTVGKRDTVFSGTLQPEKQSSNSSLKGAIADFSSFNKKGTYQLLVPGAGPSYSFQIADAVHQDIAKGAIKAFYYQRASMALEKKYAGLWARPAGHADTAVLIHPSAASATRPAGTKVSSPGGWYDAGDYNKYIVNSGITMGTMLSAYEDFPVYYDKLKLDIPESHNRLPDLLDEVLYNLRWMLTMQDPADGGVYHKCTNAAFDGMVMPGVTKADRYLVQKGTAAALDFAAVMAQSARVYRSYTTQLPGLADSCLRAAEKAWWWAIANPAVLYDQPEINKLFKPAISTGAYGDKKLEDEWSWASAELYITTGKKSYFDSWINYKLPFPGLQSWANVGRMGYFSLLRFKKQLPDIDTTLAQLEKELISNADALLTAGKKTLFETVMGGRKTDFIWGSSAVAANQGIILVNAFLLTGKRNYLDGALSNMDYLLGRNATGYSFVTGLGSKTPLHPHHRPSVADGIELPVPGLLSGGPNTSAPYQDKCKYVFTEPETCYTDDDCSYASNEIAINWNAPLAYLAGAMEALKQKAGYTR